MLTPSGRRTIMPTEQSTYEGFAILEIFGHQKYAGYVKTEYFGTACMFRIDIPPLPERERVTRSGCYVDFPPDAEPGVRSRAYAPPGSTIKECATIPYTKLFGVGAIFSMSPCDEAAALAMVAELQPRPLMLVSLPENGRLIETVPSDAAAAPASRDYKCCGGNPEDGHEPGCPAEYLTDGDDDAG